MDRQLLIAKKEVTYGTDVIPAAVDTVWAEDVTFKPTGQRVTPNPAKPGVGPVADHTYGEHAAFSFKIPLAASGTLGVAPAFGPILKACGWDEAISAVVGSESVTYSLMANPVACDSLSILWREARRAHKMLGWRGRASVELGAGNRPMLACNGIGLFIPVVAAAELVHADANFAAWKDAKPVSNGTTTMSFGGFSDLGVREFSFEQSDNVVFVDVPGQENVTLAGERTFTGKMKVTTPPIGTLNLEALWSAGTVSPFSLTHGVLQGAGNIVTVSGRAQVSDAPEYARDRGVDTTSCSLKLVPSSLTTDDDLVIVLT